MSLPPLSPEDAVVLFERLRIRAYVNVAATTILVYDFFLTVISEVNVIWPSKLNYMKVLFFLTRYLPVSDTIVGLYYAHVPDMSDATCTGTNNAQGWLFIFGISVAEIILLVRTWAIWGRVKWLGIALGIFWILGLAASIIVEAVFIDSIEYMTFPMLVAPRCVLTKANPVLGVGWIFISVLETIVVILTLVKAIEHYRLGGPSRFVSVLFRDGILFYIALFVVSLVNDSILFAGPDELEDMFTGLQRVLHSCLTSRVLLNVREASKQETLTFQANITTLRFLGPASNASETLQGGGPAEELNVP